MKLKYMMLSVMGAVALSASAQGVDARATQVSYEKTTKSNWFITLQGGAAVMHNGDNANPSFSDRVTFLPSLAVGKWHSPYYATRLKANMGHAYTFAGAAEPFAKHKNVFVGGHYDFMLDLVNFFGRADKNYFLHVVPFVGLGYEYKFDSSLDFRNEHAATANAGLQLAFNMSKRVQLVLEGEANWNGMRLSKSFPLSYENNLRLSASAGLSFGLGKVGFKPVTPLDEALVARLNGEISALRAENAELSKRPKDCPELVDAPAPLAPQADRFIAEKSILFKQGKSNVSDDQLINLFDAAKFVNEGRGQLVITGYKAKSESRFSRLAQDRAQAVAKILSEKYGVSSQAITVEWEEAPATLFTSKEAAWNRLVVIRVK